jgi:hypothetical protein
VLGQGMFLKEHFKIVIPERKLLSYVLSTDHPIGKHKARVFGRIGYHAHNYRSFIKALDELIEAYPARLVKRDQYGKTYSVEGVMKGLEGNMSVRSIWIVVGQHKNATLVTIYPLT